MKKIYLLSCSKKQNFTLLELLIAVLILVIVSTVIVGVFRETLKNYKKGMSYSEISDSLAGSFMVMESDLSRILPLSDKENVYFKGKSFSFIAIKESEDKKSSLMLIRYKVDEQKKKLYRAAVEYPDDTQDIDGKDIAFLDGVLSMDFSYTHQKDKDKKDDKKKSISKSADAGKADQAKTKNEKNKKKSPEVINVNGRIKNGNIEQDFSTAFFVTTMKASKIDAGSGTDTEKKTNDTDKNNQQKQ